ncbi:MAG: hypothetical protein U5J83_12665 [Bryobacterales bacterium]|nr:hypothetical protein [Bryobacterales bacterium]
MRSMRVPIVAAMLVLSGTIALWSQGRGRAPGNDPGTDYEVIVTPGAADGTLSFTYTGCDADCDQRPVKASGRSKRNTVSWKFRFAGEQIVMAQVNFVGGTPFFQSRQNRKNGKRKHYDDLTASERGGTLGFAQIRKNLKSLAWRTDEGVNEIEDGDEFKYDVVVMTVKDGNTKVYVADPIVIVRGSEDGDGA